MEPSSSSDPRREAPTVRPAVSVLMPVRNGARYLDAALASLAAQTLAAIEIVVVENGSTDQTPEILAEWAARDQRIALASLPDAQLAAALNHAARLARAPLLARLDADDIAMPERLAMQVATMARLPHVALLGSAVYLVDAAGRAFGRLNPPLSDRDIRERQRISCAVVPSSAMFRAGAFWQAGGFRAGLNVSEDFDLWTRIGELASMANLPDPLTAYRVHGGSVTSRHPVRMAIASYCVTAAGDARRRHAPEPFVAGVPALRRALALTGADRSRVARAIRIRALGTVLGRWFVTLRIPPALRTLSTRLGRTLRLRALYLDILRLEVVAAGASDDPPPSAPRLESGKT